MIVELQIKDGKVIVSTKDSDLLEDCGWRLVWSTDRLRRYVRSTRLMEIPYHQGVVRQWYLHTIVLERELQRALLPHEWCDFEDGNPLNCQQENLLLRTKHFRLLFPEGTPVLQYIATGEEVQVDDQDRHLLTLPGWTYNIKTHVVQRKVTEKNETHVELLKNSVAARMLDGGLQPGARVFQRDGNPLNCSRENVVLLSSKKKLKI